MLEVNKYCHSRGGGNPEIQKILIQRYLDSRLRGNDKKEYEKIRVKSLILGNRLTLLDDSLIFPKIKDLTLFDFLLVLDKPAPSYYIYSR
jgi:hypothetical protein